MTPSVLQHLDELRPETGIKTLGDLIGLKRYLQNSGQKPFLLAHSKFLNGRWIYEPSTPVEKLAIQENCVAHRKAMTLPSVIENNYTFMLNNRLMGGRDYPLLTSLAGAGASFVSGGAGLIFSAAATGISLGKTTHRILARGGDELWQREEIGKSRIGASFVPVHVVSYFLVDPFRGANDRKVWLIHEERHELAM
ncbi:MULTISPECIES: hypothetical protein [unclassified Marinimicrobium]|jgi:hypothetical protein|uniref:hypothetical protein n=1 Tax=unclassified Marinimicrobium TaxID=2632100 RepID=UPI000C426419|nr:MULTISPECIES: hypothetical protein [unclassified Marinimicrobium]MAN53305.1 hypothetical protein [Marinimicrobium sp.]|tara:strand:- start:322 stop:906 length:585 start_codon:yes stop_codon:yes gene_type:complete